MKALNVVAFALTLLGVISWLLLGLFNFSFSAMFLGYTGIRILYVIYAAAGLWLLAGIIKYVLHKSDLQNYK